MTHKKTLCVAFPDIDFQRNIENAFSTLVKDEDFLNAETNNQKEAIVILSAAFAKASSWLRWSGSDADHADYLRQYMYVGDKPHILEWDVQFCYDPFAKEVYSY
jgi:hypothetical protein